MQLTELQSPTTVGQWSLSLGFQVTTTSEQKVTCLLGNLFSEYIVVMIWLVKLFYFSHFHPLKFKLT